ncbi:MAG: CoB--CoM heterodisulfide reductase iron-sulfur subunit B family protein [Desulfomonilaceae bacterium]|nr:CoB--CoM heterodisulfide reductase iron-sulfur subunit B family protein [Desulfomonilaceae bacterium]
MKATYYPGCSLEGTARPYDLSTRQVCSALGVDLQEAPDWSCCGSSPALKMNRVLSVALSAHNIAQIERRQVGDVVVPCPFCFRRLASAQQEMKADPQLKQRVETAIETTVQGELSVHSLLGYIRNEVGLATIRENVKKPLKGLRLIPYYGCYQVRPPKVTRFDDPENPSSLDEILDALGAVVLDWDFKAECCGAALALAKTEKVTELCGRLIREAAYRGADALVVVCPLCQANLDMRQDDVRAHHGTKYSLPILYFTELMGLSFGISPSALGMDHHIHDPLILLKNKGLT